MTPEGTAGTSARRKIIQAALFRSVAATAKRKMRLTIVDTKIIQVSRRRHRPKKCVEISDQTNARLTADASRSAICAFLCVMSFSVSFIELSISCWRFDSASIALWSFSYLYFDS